MLRLLKKIKFLSAAIIFLPGVGFAANCDVQIQNNSIAINWDRNFNYQMVSFSVQKINPEPCAVRLGFSKGSSSDYNRFASSGGNSLNYQIYKDTSLSNILKDGIDALNSTDTINLSFASGTNVTQVVNYYIQIPITAMISPSYKAFGSYYDTFNIKAYDSDPLLYPVSVATVALRVSVSAILEVSLVNSGAVFDPTGVIKSIDLGDLNIPESMDLDLKVKSNVGYKVSISSQNGGNLKQESYYGSSLIPYNLTINSNKVVLSTAKNLVAITPGSTNTDGSANRVSISTVQTPNAGAGKYSDRLIFTIDADD